MGRKRNPAPPVTLITRKISKDLTMIQIATYPANDILQILKTATQNTITLPDGNKFRNSSRIQLFTLKGTHCINCGIEGIVFVLETQHPTIKPHLNLYAITPQNKHVLMTKDHHQPRSKGGTNTMDNYNTMCSPCNARKADTIPHT